MKFLFISKKIFKAIIAIIILVILGIIGYLFI